MPKLWTATIEAHRREVREAILDTTAALVATHGLRAVTMARIAAETGIGRATLYKYFPDVETILRAWHERQIASHLAHLTTIRDRAGSAGERLAAVLAAYARIHRERIGHHSGEQHGTDLAAFLHRDPHVARAQQQLHHIVRDLLIETAAVGEIRDDVAPEELATYCLYALTAAGSLPSEAAVDRLVAVVLAGLRAQG